MVPIDPGHSVIYETWAGRSHIFRSMQNIPNTNIPATDNIGLVPYGHTRVENKTTSQEKMMANVVPVKRRLGRPKRRWLNNNLPCFEATLVGFETRSS